MSREFPDQPVVGVAGIVWRGEQVLLIRRGRPPKADEWSLPGGRQELGETVAEAVRREVREETGLDVDVFGVVGVFDLIDRDPDHRIRFHYTLIDLLAEWRSGEAVASDDAAAVAWATLDELQDYALWSETERVIRLSAEQRKAQRDAD
jgi:8-oxo-dGTP diphosphatase